MPDHRKQEQLTDTRINRLTRESHESGKKIDAKDPGERGLYLRITPHGKRVWYSVVKDSGTGKTKYNQLGEYPAIGVSDARTAHRGVRERIRSGDNPTDAKRARKAQEAAIEVAAQAIRDEQHTIRNMLDLYKPGTQKETFYQSINAVKRVFADLLDRPMREITFQAINKAAQDYYHNTSKAQGRKAIGCLRAVLNKSALSVEWVPIELGQMVKMPGPQLIRAERVLTMQHMSALLPVWRDSVGHGQCMWFLAHTGLRLNEACEFKWTDLSADFKTWVLPARLLAASRSGKKNAPPYINFPHQVFSLLAEIKQTSHTDYVFSLGKMKFPGGEMSDGKLGNWGRYGKRLKDKSGITHSWNRHDIRHFAATAMGDLGIEPYVESACLGHVLLEPDIKMAGRYNKSSYSPQRAHALQTLADALEVAEKKGRDDMEELKAV